MVSRFNWFLKQFPEFFRCSENVAIAQTLPQIMAEFAVFGSKARFFAAPKSALQLKIWPRSHYKE